MKNNDEITNLIKMLESNNINYFLDSGSLLGLARDRLFLKNDQDIDIGIITNHNFDLLIDELIENGYRIVEFYWKKYMYKCKAIPQENNYKYILDFQLYFKDDNFLCCPQMVFKQNLTFFGKIKQKFIRYKKGNKHALIFRRITKLYVNRYNRVFNYYVWKIKKEYAMSYSKISGFRVFSNFQDYLSERYGNWKVPVKNWDFTKDDGCLQKMISDEFLVMMKKYENK